MSKTTIPAGYRITIETWENDDDCKTKVLEGLDHDAVAAIKKELRK